MKQPKVFFVIPHFNGKDVLKDCLESVFEIDYLGFQVIVVDNSSADGSSEFIRNDFPQVILIENRENRGFASACNQGIKWGLKCGADYVLLLNNDTVVAPDFLTKMAEAAEADEKVGIVGAKIYYFDQPEKIWFAGGDFIQWRASGKHRFWQKQNSAELGGVEPSDFVTGCAMLVKNKFFRILAVFMNRIF